MTTFSSRVVKRMGLVAAAAAWLAGSVQGGATILASDGFFYTAGAVLNGESGGTGWTTAWTTSSSLLTTQSFAGGTALQMGNGTSSFPNNDNVAYRSFASYSGDTVFLSLTVDPQSFVSGDFMMLWLDNAASGNHGTSFNLGFTTADIVAARLSSATGGGITGPTVSSGTTYTLVAELSKSVSGAANKYDTLSFWINPSNGDQATPLGSISYTAGTDPTTLSMLGFRTVSNTASNVYDVDSVTVGTTWNDVVAVPEPGGAALAAAGGVALLLLFRLRRARFAP